MERPQHLTLTECSCVQFNVPALEGGYYCNPSFTGEERPSCSRVVEPDPNPGSLATHRAPIYYWLFWRHLLSTQICARPHSKYLRVFLVPHLILSSIIMCISILKALKCPAISKLIYLCPVFLIFTWLQNFSAFLEEGGELKGKFLPVCTLGNYEQQNHFIPTLLPFKHRFETRFIFKTKQGLPESLASLCNCPHLVTLSGYHPAGPGTRIPASVHCIGMLTGNN